MFHVLPSHFPGLFSPETGVTMTSVYSTVQEYKLVLGRGWDVSEPPSLVKLLGSKYCPYLRFYFPRNSFLEIFWQSSYVIFSFGVSKWWFHWVKSSHTNLKNMRLSSIYKITLGHLLFTKKRGCLIFKNNLGCLPFATKYIWGHLPLVIL